MDSGPKTQKTDDELLAFLATPRKQGDVQKFFGRTSGPTGKRLRELEKAGKVKKEKVSTSVMWKAV